MMRRLGKWNALALVAVLCAALLGCRGSSATHDAATATTTPRALNWREITLPAGADARASGLTISPIDGRVAWLCIAESDARYQIWRTQDAANWKMVSEMTPTTPQPVSLCQLTPDAGDANAVVANFRWGDSMSNAPGGPPHGSVSYYSVDAGLSWRALSPNRWIAQVATAGSTTYALVPDDFEMLVFSSDHLATWQGVLDQPTRDTTSGQFQFATASAPGHLVWEDTTGDTKISDDNGNSWRMMPPPGSGQMAIIRMAAWHVGGAASWMMCGHLMSETTHLLVGNLCTLDEGKTWKIYPGLKQSTTCSHCGANGAAKSSTFPCLASGLGVDGSLYAICGNYSQDDGSSWTPWVVSRIAPGDAAWTTIGQAPCMNITVTRTGQMWCINTVTHANYVLDYLPR